jgi:hypothetical protein
VAKEDRTQSQHLFGRLGVRLWVPYAIGVIVLVGSAVVLMIMGASRQSAGEASGQVNSFILVGAGLVLLSVV